MALSSDDQKSVFLTWLGENGGSLVKVARAYTLNEDDTQDLIQEILLQAWRSLPTFQGNSTAATWFYRVALYTSLNWHRKDRPRRFRQKPFVETQAVINDSSDSQAQAVHQETIEQLYRAIHQLPKTDVAIILLYLDNLSYQEMSDVLGISESNVGVKLNRAKKTLTSLMKGGEQHGK